MLANVSHDARSPVSTIKLRAEMLLLGVNGTLTAQQQQSVESIESSADQLLFFVNNLLDASRLEAKGITLMRQPFSPAELIGAVVKSMAPQASAKGIGLHFTIIGTATSSIDGDAERLRQIMSNLIDNAIKFTDKGEITVSLRQPDASRLRIDVADTGIGIKPGDQGRIFEAFYQADGSMTRRQIHGVGLGLSIVKQLAELMNGTITVQSSPNVGTTFTLILPLDVVGEPPYDYR
jgi:signal transduction histidine kinase